MPIGVGTRGFFESTLDAFWKGVQGLTPTPAGGVVTDRGPVIRPGPGAPTTVSVPGIWDVMKPSAPDPTAPATLANNREIAALIRKSPEPEYISSWGEIMTAIDNVRDVLALGVIAGRITLAVNGAAEVFAAGGSIFFTSAGAAAATETALVATGEAIAAAPTVAAALEAQAAGGLLAVTVGELGAVGAATAVGSLILPTLALVAGALLIAEMAHWAAAAAIVGYAGLCRGPSEAAFAAIPAVLWGRGLKSNLTKLSRINPWSLTEQVREVKAGNVATFVGHEYVEGGRATAVLWGHGWLLGAVVGGMIASSFAAQRVANGDSVTIDTHRFTDSFVDVGRFAAAVPGGVIDTVPELMRSKLGRSPIPGSNISLYAAQAAAELLWSLPNLVGLIDGMRPVDFYQVLCAQLLALDILQPYLNGIGWQAVASEVKGHGIAAPPIWTPWTKDLLRENGLPLDQARRWALPGAPEYLYIDQIDATFTAALDQKLQAWFLKYNGWFEAAFCGSLLDSIVQRLYWIITESDDGLRTSAAPPWKVLFALAESNRQPLVTYGPETLAAFWADCETKMAREGRNTLTAPELDQLAAACGMRLLVLKPPQVST